MKEFKTAEILCVGTELLLGDIINTNAAYLARELAGLGISVYRQTVVGDNPERLSNAFSDAVMRADVVLVTGGLGPTCDDLTRETAAAHFGRKLIFHQKIADEMLDYFTHTGRNMPENNLRQAMVPEGADILYNSCGTAPGLWLENEDGKAVIMMPGVPSEMYEMFEKQVKPRLLSRRSSVLASRNIHLFGIGESAAEAILKPMMDSGVNPTVAPYAKDGEVRIRITAMSSTEEKALELCDAVIEKIKATEVGKFIYGIDVGSLENALVLSLRKFKKTVACAESCTGGLIAKRIVDISGCSEAFLGGAVTYSNSAKTKMINVSKETLELYGAVSEQTAVEMARGIRIALGSDIGISTTGIAGPGGGTEEKPVGTVYVGVSSRNGDRAFRLNLSPHRSREFLRFVSSSHALHAALIESKEI